MPDKQAIKLAFTEKLKNILVSMAALMIALGEYSEAISLVDDAVEYLQKQFTHELDYEQLQKLNVGNTVAYAESLMGAPQVARMIDEKTSANYFYTEKYLVTLFYRDDRVAAYTIAVLEEGFEPKISKQSELAIGEFVFTQYPAKISHYSVDFSKAVAYYLENQSSGSSGMFVENYLGSLEYAAGGVDREQLASLYKADVHGTEEEFFAVLEGYRESSYPNFFGQGELSLAEVERGLLTEAEFKNYFDQ